MATIRRRIDGPQDFHEQRGGAAYRDTRSVSRQLRELLTTGFSAVGLVGLGVVTVAVPATTTLTLPIALGFAAYVLTRPVILPIRLPAITKRKDYGNPEPHPRREGAYVPGPPSADTFIGWDETTGQQIWMSAEDMTMHGLLPGATGAGKTQAIFSLLCNALAQGSGFTLVDGKAQNDLVFTVMAMARRWGREADVRVINLLVGSGDRKTHTWNPFNSLSAEGLTEVLLVLFLPQQQSGDNKYFLDKANALIRCMAYIFIWVRDHLGISITAQTMATMFSDVNRLSRLVEERTFAYYSAEEQRVKQVVLPDSFPGDLIHAVENYLTQTGGYSANMEATQWAKVIEQHGYVSGGFLNTLGAMGKTFGHVFGASVSDVDFDDILYNRRILVVLLPSLENSPGTNAALGKMVVTALRYGLARSLGASIEGRFGDVVLHRPSSAKSPYPIVLDEVGQYATEGIDKMSALGRSLNVCLLLSFQELGTLYANLGRDLSVPLLGNAKLKIFMNLEDAGPTRQWVEDTGGMVPVSVLPGYDSSSALGTYSGQQRADIRHEKRINWNDVQSLQRGQAIILFRGRRIYARLFYAGIGASMDADEISRLFPTVMRRRVLIEANPERSLHDTIRAHIEAGDDLVTEDEIEDPAEPLLEVYNRLAIRIQEAGTPASDADFLFQQVSAREPEKVTLASIFGGWAQPTTQLPRTSDPLHPAVEPELLDELVSFEVAMGAEAQVARESVIHALNLYARGQEMQRQAGQSTGQALSKSSGRSLRPNDSDADAGTRT